MSRRVLVGAFGSSSGITPSPWPTNTPAPTLTEDLLPMMTLGCGDRLDRVPSGQMMAPPESNPRRPSSQGTSAPCASDGPAPAAHTADPRIENASARSMVVPPLRQLDCRYMNRRPQPVFASTPGNAKPGADRNVKLSNFFNWLCKFLP